MKRAFTLIELLVVVLIIGILSAIALPQYQKAVMKTRYATLKNLTRSLADAQQLYHLANDQYATTFEQLAFEVPGITSTSLNGKAQYFKDGVCTIEASYCYCMNTNINMAYRIDYGTGQRACVAYDSDSTSNSHQICKAETGLSGPSEGYSSTYFYL